MTNSKVFVQIFLTLWIFPLIIESNNLLKAQTQQGVYIGRQTDLINNIRVNYWYGIPYAQQPVDNLRWKPPQPLSTANDTNFAYMFNCCPQRHTYGIPSTEACLTLNVYAPENAMNLPVYVWIHGGSFTSGAGIMYNATDFVSTAANNSLPVVFVTINYRLGLLGFLADQALYDEKSGSHNQSTTGNYGLLDQMVALDWIKKNIRGFGGNPEQITIGGESAGGASVTILLTSPLVANDTFQRAIIESGAIWPSATAPLQLAINNSGIIVRTLSECTTLQCMRNLSVDQILKIQDVITDQSLFGTAAVPVIDGYVLDDIMENYYARGQFQRVPALIGSTTNETSLFTCPYFHGSATVDQVEDFFSKVYNTTIINQLSTIYGSITSYNNPLSYLNTVYSDSWVHCGSRRVAAKFSSSGLPSYLFTYNHLIPVAAACLGVAHAAELPMLFPGTLSNMFPNYNLTEQEQQLSKNMMLYWASFIRTSNPSYVGAPTRWDSYQIISDNDLVLNIQSNMRNYFYNSTCSGLWDFYAVTNSSSIFSSFQ